MKRIIESATVTLPLAEFKSLETVVDKQEREIFDLEKKLELLQKVYDVVMDPDGTIEAIRDAFEDNIKRNRRPGI